jgi:hypothetical protein
MGISGLFTTRSTHGASTICFLALSLFGAIRGHGVDIDKVPTQLLLSYVLHFTVLTVIFGAPDRIRTCDLCLRRAVVLVSWQFLGLPHRAESPKKLR